MLSASPGRTRRGRSQQGDRGAAQHELGSLSRLFAGGIELKVKHVLDILKQIDMSPADFFRLAYPEDDSGGSETAIALKGFLGHGLQVKTESVRRRPGGTNPTQEDIEAMVAKALRKLLLGS